MSEERRCIVCDRLEMHPNAHDGYNCKDWPERAIGQTETLYRDFVISHSWIGWQWVHKDYDGPDDRRAGTERNLVDCFKAIDDWHDDQS